MRQWRCRVGRVRQQPETFAAILSPRIACSLPLFLAGTSKRVVNSQTWSALRLSRCARTSPGWLPFVPGAGQVGGDADRDGLVVVVAQVGEQVGVEPVRAVSAGGLDR